MNGTDLYALYVLANAEEYIGVDRWEELAEEDVRIWNRIAELAVTLNRVVLAPSTPVKQR